MFGLLIVLMATGMPVSFTFIFICIIGAYLFWGGEAGLEQLAMSFYSSVTNYNFLPIPLFILMGDIVFTSGTGTRLIDAVDQILGKVPGRLSILAIGSGVLLGTMIGISGGSIGILGKVLVPEMERRGYAKSMTLGPIVSSGTLAILIPPSALAVFLGAVAQVSIGKLLLAIIVPGLMVSTRSWPRIMRFLAYRSRKKSIPDSLR
jgi:TRAP-type C4-dicarboxylate transport system permease large subunit